MYGTVHFFPCYLSRCLPPIKKERKKNIVPALCHCHTHASLYFAPNP